MNPRRWFRKHSLRLLAIRDTPEAIAGGVAIGLFFGFSPLFGFKTMLAILFAWLTGSNILAAVIAVTMHDILLPFMPVIYRWEYDLGYWLLSHPHEWPPHLHRIHWEGFAWRAWTIFLFGDVGKRLVLGGAVCGAPVAMVAFFVTRSLVARRQRKRLKRSAPDEPEANPS
jgi:uncharacterized protein